MHSLIKHINMLCEENGYDGFWSIKFSLLQALSCWSRKYRKKTKVQSGCSTLSHEWHTFQGTAFAFVKQLRAAVRSKPWITGRNQYPRQALFPSHEGIKYYAENFRPRNLISISKIFARTIKQATSRSISRYTYLKEKTKQLLCQWGQKGKWRKDAKETG